MEEKETDDLDLTNLEVYNDVEGQSMDLDIDDIMDENDDDFDDNEEIPKSQVLGIVCPHCEKGIRIIIEPIEEKLNFDDFDEDF